MKVKILTEVSDHARSYGIGEVCDMAPDQAERWIKAGYVEVLKSSPESATLADAEDRATLPRAKRRGDLSV